MAMVLDTYLEDLYRSESGRILATLIRLLGDFDLAEDAMHEAFRVALEQWPAAGTPANPVAWLISAGRFKGIDRLRQAARHEAALAASAERPEDAVPAAIDGAMDPGFADDRLRLVFICCHPALPAEARAALTLREVCGLTTEEIARAFLATPAATAQRIVRAKNKIRDERLPYEIPSRADLPARLGSVLQVIYLVFNEGYSASSGASITRADLSAEAIRLGRLVLELLGDPEVQGLLALMLLQESRRVARASRDGEVILLEDQDRSLWDRALIDEGLALVETALASGRAGAYSLQAAIAGVHASAATAADTDWSRIVDLYDRLAKVSPSPVVALNRAVAVAMRDGAAAGLALIEDIVARGDLADYHPLHAARAELCRRVGKVDEARTGYARALALTRQDPERRLFARRLRELG